MANGTFTVVRLESQLDRTRYQIGQSDKTESAVSQTFNAAKKIQSATAYITARGLYEACINGKRVGDAFLTPGWTSYRKRLQYQQYDVTDLLR
ncbi:alpha-L-rhamnosidase N-terminal domain-containing protein, partial [Chitinophaga pinensis]|uniref:alpha-L-rhamnosidase N-terminal domain-containing protein n=1 Tax=Chitinophaga pinensis TaxID=79329 RepID=UPI0021BDE0D3